MKNIIKSKMWGISDKDFPKKASFESKIKYLLNYGILAPSSHNMQPWNFKIEDNKLEVYLDTDRRLLFSDRANRQGFISLGCCIANILLAAEHFGLYYEIEYLPDTPFDDLAATISFTNIKTNKKCLFSPYSNLFKFIKLRNTNRNSHTNKKIPSEVFMEADKIAIYFGMHVKIFDKRKDLQNIAKIFGNSSLAAFGNSFFKKELSNWVISAYSKRKDGIPLYDFGLPYPITTLAKYLILNTKPEIQRNIDVANIKNARSIVILISENDRKIDWIKTGFVFQTLALFTTKQGLSLAPMAGIIEYPDSRQDLSTFMNLGNSYPNFFARMGYSSKPTQHSPRKNVDDVLR